MYLTYKFETSGVDKDACFCELARCLNLLNSFLLSEYKGKGSLNATTINLDWKAETDLHAYIIFQSESFTCTAEFNDFMERFEIFRKEV